MSLAVEPMEPSPAVKERLLERVRATSGLRDPLPTANEDLAPATRRPSRRMSPAFAAVAASLVVAFGMQYLYAPQQQRLDDVVAEQERELDQLRSDSASVTAELAATRASLEHLERPDLEIVSLAGTEPQPDASARVFWDRETGEWRMYVADLRPLPAGRTYELWAITEDGAKLPMGTFDVDPSGDGFLVVRLGPVDAKVVAAAVTDEPEGGVDSPTGSIHLLGKFVATAS